MASIVGLHVNPDNLYVGIGTTNPGYPLHIQGTIFSSGGINATTQLLAPSADTVTAPGYSWVGDTNTGLFHPTADTLALTTAGVERMRVLSNGNVGVGTTTPKQKLDVVGNIISTGSIDTGTQFFGNDADSAAAPSFSFTSDPNMGLYRAGTDIIGLSTAGVERMRVLADGKVGIGTATPLTSLHVEGDIQSPCLTGQVSYFARNAAPTGWLKCNGAAISRTTYAKLFVAIGTTFGVGDGSTTFTLPDLRGEFVRGWDDARGVDTSRVFGSAQTDLMENHTHSGTTVAGGSHYHTSGTRRIHDAANGQYGSTSSPGSVSFPLARFDGSANYELDYTDTVANHTHTITTGNPSTGGGTETRPRNVALLACIKF